MTKVSGGIKPDMKGFVKMDYNFAEMKTIEVARLVDNMTETEVAEFFDKLTDTQLTQFLNTFFNEDSGEREELAILKGRDKKFFVVQSRDLDFNPENGDWHWNAKVYLQRLRNEKRAFIGTIVNPKTLNREQIMGCLKEAYEENYI